MPGTDRRTLRWRARRRWSRGGAVTGIGRFTVENSDVPKLGELNADQQKTCKNP